MIIPSRRGFLAGLAALFAAPAIVKASNLMPVKVMKPIGPEIILSGGDEWWSRGQMLLWRAKPGEELICSTGRKVVGLVRYSESSSLFALSDKKETLDWHVERHPDGSLFVKNVDEIRYTYEKDGHVYYSVDTPSNLYPRGAGHLAGIPWSYGTELPKPENAVRI